MTWHRGQYLRHVLDRQWPAHELLAGCSDDAIPQREELELGRRLPGAGDVPLAGQDQAGPGVQRYRRPPRHAADLLAVAGDTDVKDKLAKGYKVGDMTYKVHLDGDNLVPYLTGQTAKGPRESFFYINDDQQLMGLRYDNWKLAFMEQRAPGTLRVWSEPFTNLRIPKISISALTRMSGRISPRTPTTTGFSITLSCLSRRRTMSASS